MGTFGVNPFGTAQFGGAGGAGVVPGTQLQTLLYAAFRIAGVTDRPGRTPSIDQFGDAIPTLNRMLGLWSIDPLRITGIVINAYPLVPGQKTYQIGPGGADFPAAARPIEIQSANVIVNTTTPVVREEIRLITPQQWAAISVQDIPGTIPWALYNDAGTPYSTLYLYGQALTTYQLELFTWQAIPSFAAVTDIVVLPPGYEEAIVWNLAIRLAAVFPTQQQMNPRAEIFARDALSAIESFNSLPTTMKCDPAIVRAGGGRAFDYYAYLNGDF